MQDAMGRISLLEIESMDRKGGQLREGPITVVLGMVKAFGKLQLAVVWHWTMDFGFLRGSTKQWCCDPGG